MTLAISILTSVCSLHTKMQSIISSILMFYDECHDVIKFSPNKVTDDNEGYHIG